jgi:hypothetical protein
MGEFPFADVSQSTSRQVVPTTRCARVHLPACRRTACRKKWPREPEKGPKAVLSVSYLRPTSEAEGQGYAHHTFFYSLQNCSDRYDRSPPKAAGEGFRSALAQGSAALGSRKAASVPDEYSLRRLGMDLPPGEHNADDVVKQGASLPLYRESSNACRSAVMLGSLSGGFRSGKVIRRIGSMRKLLASSGAQPWGILGTTEKRPSPMHIPACAAIQSSSSACRPFVLRIQLAA